MITMKIKRISLWQIPLTSHKPYYMSEGKTCDKIDTIVIRIDSDNGYSGWGEVCPIPHYLPAYADGVAPAINDMSPKLINQEFTAPEAMMATVDRWLIGHHYAKSVIDMALWDLLGKVTQQPVYKLLGGKRNEKLPLYHSITCIHPDEMVKIAQDAYAHHIRQIQVKLGADNDLCADIERLIKVREAMPKDVLVYGDWNAGIDKLSAIRVGRAVQHLDIMIEQPCETIEQCAEVKISTGLAMKLDETAYDFHSLMKGASLGCMDAVAIKLSKFGGITKAKYASKLCCELGTKMCIEDTWGSDITTSAILHLAATTDAKFIMNVCDLSYYVSPRLDITCPHRDHGMIAINDAVGLGVTPQLDNPQQIFD